MRQSIVFLLVFLVCASNRAAFPASGPVSDKEVELRWTELGAFLAGANSLNAGKAVVALPDGAVVQGQIAEVQDDALVLDVSKSSNKAAHPKGRAFLPRASVSTIRLTLTKGTKGRIIGTVAGILGGSLLGAVIALSAGDEPSGGARAGVVALWVGTGVAGYYAGRAFDRRTITVRVVPPAP